MIRTATLGKYDLTDKGEDALAYSDEFLDDLERARDPSVCRSILENLEAEGPANHWDIPGAYRVDFDWLERKGYVRLL